MIKPAIFFSSVLTIVALLSCENNSTPSETSDTNRSSHFIKPQEEETPDTLMLNSMQQLLDSNYEGKIVAVEGYISVPSMVFIEGAQYQLSLYPEKNKKTDRFADLHIVVGSENNTMDSLSKGGRFDRKNFVLRDNEGELVQENERVKITGKIKSFQREEGGYHPDFDFVYKIEKVDE